MRNIWKKKLLQPEASWHGGQHLPPAQASTSQVQHPNSWVLFNDSDLSPILMISRLGMPVVQPRINSLTQTCSCCEYCSMFCYGYYNDFTVSGKSQHSESEFKLWVQHASGSNQTLHSSCIHSCQFSTLADNPWCYPSIRHCEYMFNDLSRISLTQAQAHWHNPAAAKETKDKRSWEIPQPVGCTFVSIVCSMIFHGY
jgi:hypothetical protein